MTVDERLAEWLEQTTPEPPRQVSVADVALRVQRRRRVWQPLLAAACVALVAAITIVIATRSTKHSAAPPARPTPQSTTPQPTTPTSAPAMQLPIKPWHARTLRASAILISWGSLTSDGKSLYVTGYNGGLTWLDRVNPDTGGTAARFETRDAAIQGGPVFANGRLWLLLEWRGSMWLQSFDALGLAPGRKFPAVHGRASVVGMVAQGTSIYVATRSRVMAFDTRTGAIIRMFSKVSHAIGAIAVRGNVLYVGTGYGAGGGDLSSFDVNSGSLIDFKPNTGSIRAITATSGGLWITEASGTTATVYFNAKIVQTGGGGSPLTVDVEGPTAWLGGNGFIKCANPNTGSVRAQASGQGRGVSETVWDITVAAGRTFAWVYAGQPVQYLVELHPPAACR